MPLLKKRKPLVGLDIGSSSVKAVELSRSKKGYQLTGFACEGLGPDVVVDGAIMDAPAMAASIRETLAAGKFKPRRVFRDIRSSLSGLLCQRRLRMRLKLHSSWMPSSTSLSRSQMCTWTINLLDQA